MLWASISYCMVYFSVLDNGSLVAAYLKTQGIGYHIIGIAKACGAFFGICGTFLTPLLVNRYGLTLELVGMMSVWLFWICLSPSGIQFVAEEMFDTGVFHFNDAYVILGCMMVARCGLWAFDLAENQMMQERVDEDVRAQVNGVQVSVSQMFMIFVSAFAMVFNGTSGIYFHSVICSSLCTLYDVL